MKLRFQFGGITEYAPGFKQQGVESGMQKTLIKRIYEDRIIRVISAAKKLIPHYRIPGKETDQLVL
jgi:hypothetical protein